MHDPTRLLLLCAFVCPLVACQSSSPTTPGGGTNAVRYTALGASDAIGYGGSVVCNPFSACPNGTGYVQTIARRLDAVHEDFQSTNLGIPGAVVSRRMMDLGNGLGLGIFGNFAESQVPFVPRETTIVTVFAGANDANTVARAVQAGRAGADVTGYLNAQISSFAQEFQDLINGIRGRATGSKVVILNLPNLARLPYMAGRSSTERGWMRQLAVGYSAAMNAMRSAEVLVVDLMCHGPVYDSNIYSSDGFHPDDEGYVLLADLVSAALANAPGPPAASCGFMT